MRSRSVTRSRFGPENCALRIAVVYLVVGGLWIALSDRLLLWVVGKTRHGDSLTRLQTYKGWLFVVITTALLYLLIRRAIRAIQHSNQMIAAAKESAEAANRAKDHFLAILSHELRTPLTPVMATISALADEAGLQEAVRSDLQVIRRNVELEIQLIDDLLDLNRIATGKLHLKQEVVDVQQLVANAAEICRAEISGKNLKDTVKLEAEQAAVRGDDGRLLQVFWNILKNAVKFTPEGGSIQVRCANGAGVGGRPRVVVEVRDTGVGIEPEALQRVFNAFDQGSDIVTQRYGGLGLGLAISKSIVEAHGGTISAQSEGRGRGSTFMVAIPTVDRMEEQKAKAQRRPPRRPSRWTFFWWRMMRTRRGSWAGCCRRMGIA